jgi:hypothetical protein
VFALSNGNAMAADRHCRDTIATADLDSRSCCARSPQHLLDLTRLSAARTAARACDSPILLLDDVSSELDPQRNEYLFEHLAAGWRGGEREADLRHASGACARLARGLVGGRQSTRAVVLARSAAAGCAERATAL